MEVLWGRQLIVHVFSRDCGRVNPKHEVKLNIDTAWRCRAV